MRSPKAEALLIAKGLSVADTYHIMSGQVLVILNEVKNL
jgi:hypothetical protein